MGLTFKKATDKDIPVIQDLVDRIWKKHYLPIIGAKQVDYMLAKNYTTESIQKQMKDQQEYTLVYNGADNPIGYISLRMKDQNNFFLHKFYIDGEQRSKGIGTEVLNHILSTLPEAATIELTVNRQNYKSINFYFKNGFTIKEVADFDIGDGYFMNDFVMHRRPKL